MGLVFLLFCSYVIYEDDLVCSWCNIPKFLLRNCFQLFQSRRVALLPNLSLTESKPHFCRCAKLFKSVDSRAYQSDSPGNLGCGCSPATI